LKKIGRKCCKHEAVGIDEMIHYLKKIDLVCLLKVVLYVILIITVYYSALRYLIIIDWAREDYSHSYLIPLVLIYILWEKRGKLSSIPASPAWTGLIPFMFGLFLYWLGELGGEYFTMYISLWFVLVGLLWMHMGWQKIKAMGFVLVMFLTMFPFPNFINTKILVNLRLISSQIGVSLLQIVGMSAYREGNIIDLGFTQLQVVDACSGLRYVIPFFVISLILAYWFRGAIWKKAVVVLSSIPLAVAVNSLRIAITGILYNYWGAKVAEGFFHDFSGWLIFMFTIPVLLLETWVLNRVGPPVSKEVSRESIAETLPLHDPSTNSGQGVIKGLIHPVFLISIALMIGTLACTQRIEFREKIPIKKSFDQFPLSIGGWTGERLAMEQQFIQALHLSDYIMINYLNQRGQCINFYVAYYESQRKGEGTHSPETCLPGSGWEFKQSGIVTVDTGRGQEARVNKAIMAKGDTRQLVYFWFPQRGRILTSLYQVKLYAFWDALISQRTDGALVRIITPLSEGEDAEEAEERLISFVRLITPVLEQYLPRS